MKTIAIMFTWAALCATPLHCSYAAEQCGIPTPAGLACRAYVQGYKDRIHVSKQRTPVTCWAASLSNLLTFYGQTVSEEQIVSQTIGAPTLATSIVMNAVLNHDYKNDANHSVSVSTLGITDNVWNTAHNITNADIYNALRHDTPVFYGDTTHAMIVVDALFVPSAAGPTPISAVAADPAPNMPNFRVLSPQEMIGMYAAIISVKTDTAGAAPASTGGNFCAVLRRVIASSPSRFVSFRGRSDDEGGWDAKVSLPGMREECSVQSNPLNYYCQTDADFSQVESDVEACIPGWRKEARTRADGRSVNMYFAPTGRTDVGINETTSGHVAISVEEHEE